jgi:hypothetical protein
MSDPSPEPAPDPAVFAAAAERLADRFRSMPQSRLAQLAPDGLLLADRMARRARQLEGGAVRPPLPDLGIFVVGDQIALTAHDLALALTQSVADPTAAGSLADSLAEVEQLYRLATTRSARM